VDERLRKRLRLIAGALLLFALPATVLGTTGKASSTRVPATILAVMHGPRYAHSKWSLLVTDLKTGTTVYALDPDRMAFTGSVRKLFSVGVALNELGASHRFHTPVYRRGSIGAGGVLRGDLILVGGGDLTLGGRLGSNGGVAFTNFDHNDANNLGTAALTPQDPLRGLNALAREVRAVGFTR
jgi:D-alanyl-D-alanine carboxypeptidase